MCCSCPTHAVESRVLRRLAKDGFGRLFYWPSELNESATCMRHNAPMAIERSLLLTSVLLLTGHAALAQAPVYRCPGPPVLYTDALSAREAQERGCRTIEGTPITVIQAQKPRAPAANTSSAAGADGGAKVDPAQQRARDSERRRVLEDELRAAEGRLAAAQAEYQNGNGEKRGDEARNYQKYLDRMAELKASINRQQSDIEAIKREIGKLPS